MGAPRLAVRRWRGPARGACLAWSLWLTASGAVGCPAADVAPVAGSAVALQDGFAPGTIKAAHYEDLTARYAHGVLGDALEPETLTVRLDGDCGPVLRLTLGEEQVFEDIAPRLVDLEGDGSHEVIVVQSHRDLGARLAVFGLRDGALAMVAATPYIGTRHRWLAPVAVADLDGDGAVEIAYIDRPHLARTLRIWRYAGGRLVEVAAAQSFSNHRIGWSYIEGGLRDCGAGPEMVLASGDWRHVMAVRFDGAIAARRLGPYSPRRVAEALNCR